MYDLYPTEYSHMKSFNSAIATLSKTERTDYMSTTGDMEIKDNGQLHFSVDNKNHKLPFCDAGMNRLLSSLKIPNGFAFNIIDNALLTENINDLISKQAHFQIITEKIKDQEFITGFRPDFCSPLRDHEVVEMLKQEFKDQKISPRVLTRSPAGMRIHWVNDDSKIAGLNNSAIGVGGELDYSEYGAKKPLAISAALMIMICTNGMVMNKNIFQHKYKHSGDRYKAVSNVAEGLNALSDVDYSPVEQMFSNMGKYHATPKVFQVIRNKVGRLYGKEGFDDCVKSKTSYWDILNEVTRIAHEKVRDVRLRQKMEMLGGDIINSFEIIENRIAIEKKAISVN